IVVESERPKLAPDLLTPLMRIHGETRIQTAIEISKKLFPQEKSAAAVVLARADDFPDALAGAPLAYNVGGPLLMTNTSALHADTATEIARVLKSGGDVCVLGGTAAISDNVVQTLKDDGYSVSRLGGADRYETAVKIAEALGDAPEKAFLVTGQNFPDAVAVSSAAARLRAPVLLTTAQNLSNSTKGYLSEYDIEDIYVIGGTAAISDTVYVAAGGTKRLGGADRWETAVAIAKEFFPAPQIVTVATGLSFPDALSGGVLAAAGEAPVLLTHPERLPEATGGYILQASDMLVQTFVFGGPDAVSAGVFDKIAGLLP
ncbi:MAG: cell wall-binding repeat-containing protein, partial [Firmicutes bacterium]|nr:cell wall-binding repeat-containing protein [Bacillota bacterium]